MVSITPRILFRMRSRRDSVGFGPTWLRSIGLLGLIIGVMRTLIGKIGDGRVCVRWRAESVVLLMVEVVRVFGLRRYGGLRRFLTVRTKIIAIWLLRCFFSLLLLI